LLSANCQFSALNLKIYIGFEALKSHVEIWLNNIHIACTPLNKVIKRKFYKRDSEFCGSLNLSSFANFSLSLCDNFTSKN
jgi:hypothetical protein